MTSNIALTKEIIEENSSETRGILRTKMPHVSLSPIYLFTKTVTSDGILVNTKTEGSPGSIIYPIATSILNP